MKDHFGLEAPHKKWKLFLILVQHGYGCFLKNAKHSTVQFTTKNLIIKNQKNSSKTLMEDNFSSMEKEQYLGIQLKIKCAFQIKINIACMIFHF